MSQKRRPVTRKRPDPPSAGPRSKAPILYIVVVAIMVLSLVFAGLSSVDWASLFPESVEPTPDYNTDQIAIQQTVVAQNPDDAEAHIQLASMLANSGRMPEAIPVFEEAIRLDPDTPQHRLDFARALQANGMRADAEAQFLRVLSNDPENHTAHYYLARLYMDWQPSRQEEAVGHFQRVIELAPDSFLAEQATSVLDTLGPSTPVEYVITPISSPTYAD